MPSPVAAIPEAARTPAVTPLPAAQALPFRDGPGEPPQEEPAATGATPDEVDTLRSWAREDPAAAIRWLATAPPGERRDAVLEVVCAEVRLHDAPEAAALAERYARQNAPLREYLVQAWAAEDDEAALAHAQAEPAGELRSRLVARVAWVRAGSDPVGAASLVLMEINQPELRDEAVIAIVHRWAQRDAAAAKAWLSAWPASPLRDRAKGEVH